MLIASRSSDYMGVEKYIVASTSSEAAKYIVYEKAGNNYVATLV